MFWVFNHIRFIFALLLTLHILWIGVHIYLVKNHHLNQWKLGGYGMYTSPTPRFRLKAYVSGFDAEDQKWKRKPNFSQTNWNFIMPCQPLSEKSITSFYQDNLRAIGRNTNLTVLIKSFLRYPIEAKYKPRITLKIIWSDANNFTWEGSVCGQPSKGQGQWLL